MNAPTPIKNLLPASDVQQGQDIVHESAHLHVTGSATYIDDIPEHAGTLYAALVLSPVAHGELIGDGIDRAAILKEHGVVAVYTAKDIPGENNCGPIIHDDPFLAAGKVEFLGQAVAVVVAREMLYAREAAKKAKVLVKELTPILTIEEAMAASSFIMPPKGITRGDAAAAIASAPHKIQGTTRTGQQEQFCGAQRRRPAHAVRVDPAPRRQPARSRARPEPAHQRCGGDLPPHGGRLWWQRR
jgi:xanthine dehydrogenase large subunit